MILKQKLTILRACDEKQRFGEYHHVGDGGGARGGGRPRRRWLDEVVETTGLNIWEVQEATRDRREWRRFVTKVAIDRKRPDGTLYLIVIISRLHHRVLKKGVL